MPISTKTQKLRVLIVAPSFDILGGQAIQAARLLERLKQEPTLEAGFLAVNPRLPAPLRWLQRIKYVRTVFTSIAYIASLFTRVRKHDVIHIFSASYFSFLLAPTPALIISKLYGKRILLNYHSGEAEDHLLRWRRSAIPVIRLADELVVPSEYLVRVFAQFDLHAKSIHNLIEMDRFPFRERRSLRPIFLSNRNFEKHYGVDRVLRAFAIIQEALPDARLIVAGDGPERIALERLARDLSLQNSEFTGRVGPEKIVELYDSADIFLNGSETDNQPLSLLEAFACGLPVVTTDAGGIPDMVSPGKTALVVSRGDHEQIAANALRLLNDPPLAQSIIEQAREECRKYKWDAVHDQWLDLYYELARELQVRPRTFEPNGALLATAEFVEKEDSSQRRARLKENHKTAL
ncbi:MAG: glycosyltransferase family 4 protein [Pyrinomonadaceae bacterium]